MLLIGEATDRFPRLFNALGLGMRHAERPHLPLQQERGTLETYT